MRRQQFRNRASLKHKNHNMDCAECAAEHNAAKPRRAGQRSRNTSRHGQGQRTQCGTTNMEWERTLKHLQKNCVQYTLTEKKTTHNGGTPNQRQRWRVVAVHPKCSAALSSSSIDVATSMCGTCCFSIASFRSSAREVWLASQPSECAVPHSTGNRGTDRKTMDEINRPRAQNRPLGPSAWHPQIATASPSYPVGRVRVSLHPCRTRFNIPWCGRALSYQQLSTLSYSLLGGALRRAGNFE